VKKREEEREKKNKRPLVTAAAASLVRLKPLPPLEKKRSLPSPNLQCEPERLVSFLLFAAQSNHLDVIYHERTGGGASEAFKAPRAGLPWKNGKKGKAATCASAPWQPSSFPFIFRVLDAFGRVSICLRLRIETSTRRFFEKVEQEKVVQWRNSASRFTTKRAANSGGLIDWCERARAKREKKRKAKQSYSP